MLFLNMRAKEMNSDLTGSQKDIILNLGIKGANSVLDVGCGNGEKMDSNRQ